jgi:hypothetical protein
VKLSENPRTSHNPVRLEQGASIMATFAHAGTVTSVTATPVRRRTHATLVSLGVVAVMIGATSAIVYSQLGQIHFAPASAKELTRVSALRTEAGDRLAALAATRKAIEVYRRLLRTNAIQYAPYLAASLQNLSLQLSEAGDDAGAVAAIDEAIRIRRRLAEMDPSRYAEALEQTVELRSQIAPAQADGR